MTSLCDALRMILFLSALLPPPGLAAACLDRVRSGIGNGPQKLDYKSPSARRRDSARIAAWAAAKQTRRLAAEDLAPAFSACLRQHPDVLNDVAGGSAGLAIVAPFATTKMEA